MILNFIYLPKIAKTAHMCAAETTENCMEAVPVYASSHDLCWITKCSKRLGKKQGEKTIQIKWSRTPLTNFEKWNHRVYLLTVDCHCPCSDSSHVTAPYKLSFYYYYYYYYCRPNLLQCRLKRSAAHECRDIIIPATRFRMLFWWLISVTWYIGFR